MKILVSRTASFIGFQLAKEFFFNVFYKAKISLFYGAEMSYGMPSGGEFVLKIFCQDQRTSKKLFRNKIVEMDVSSFQAREWLVESYVDKQVSIQYETFVKFSLEYKRTTLLEYLNNFDKKLELLFKKYDVKLDKIGNYVKENLKIDIDKILL